MNACTKQYYSIDVRGWKEGIYIICHSPEERDKELQKLYDRWENDDEWRVANPVIILEVHRYSTGSLMHGRY